MNHAAMGQDLCGWDQNPTQTKIENGRFFGGRDLPGGMGFQHTFFRFIPSLSSTEVCEGGATCVPGFAKHEVFLSRSIKRIFIRNKMSSNKIMGPPSPKKLAEKRTLCFTQLKILHTPVCLSPPSSPVRRVYGFFFVG
mmetsp:Transcript_23787/g.27407  ORF Transcript_23787/g.27407 Transcript_23787/m.27407 type:complete len:138 (-) Transcript_23787:108-521(-)